MPVQFLENRHFVHRIIASEFVEKVEGKLFVNHKNGNKQDNRAENLEWVTRSENDKHAIRTGLRKIQVNNILSIEDVLKIRKLLKNKNCSDIAKIYKVHRKTISDIKNGKTWKNI